MSARIALEPINISLPSVTDYRSRMTGGKSSGDTGAGQHPDPESDAEAAPRSPGSLPPLPEPAAPPSATFAVAMLSAELPLHPKAAREARLRLGSAELPAYGSLALTDRLV